MNEEMTVCDFCGESMLYSEAYQHLDNCHENQVDAAMASITEDQLVSP